MNTLAESLGGWLLRTSIEGTILITLVLGVILLATASISASVIGPLFSSMPTERATSMTTIVNSTSPANTQIKTRVKSSCLSLIY